MAWRKWVGVIVGLLLFSYQGYAFQTLVLRLKKPKIIVVHGLNFGSYVAGGVLQAVVKPSAEGAAVFNLRGEANARFQLLIVGNQIQVTNQTDHGQITINHFRFGGNVSPEGKGRFDPRGEVNNVRIGAVAQLNRQAKPGKYNGKSIVRITYF